ncbi:unnamed protein product [Meganyctiphanes norvegica]|uniref:Uncharacterized protein n=1 Tax=Meganyctiphanes norvegica TaxID=48144 RepID=A0AAV2QLJ2_MEGNR
MECESNTEIMDYNNGYTHMVYFQCVFLCTLLNDHYIQRTIIEPFYCQRTYFHTSSIEMGHALTRINTSSIVTSTSFVWFRPNMCSQGTHKITTMLENLFKLFALIWFLHGVFSDGL